MRPPRRILHIATRYLRAGSERNLLHSMEWEREAGFEVELATSAASDLAGLAEHFPVHQLDVLQREIHPRRDLVAVRQLRAIVERGRHDIVHTHQSKAGILGRVAARGRVRKIVHTVHMASFGPGYSPIASAAFRMAERRTAGMTHVTVFVGDELRSFYINAGVCRSETSMVIRSPIDIPSFAASRTWPSHRRLEVRRAHGLPVDGQLVVWIGALTRRKRPVLAVRRLAETLKSSDARLVIAGDGPERAAIRATAVAEGVGQWVHLLGHVDDVAGLLAAADVVIHTSTVEGVPQVVIQALAAGRPVVATEVIGLREVTDAPITIVPPSGDGLADAIAARLRAESDAVPIQDLEPWNMVEVDRHIHRLHEMLRWD